MNPAQRVAVVALITNGGTLAHPVTTNPRDAQAPCPSAVLDFAQWMSWT